MQEIIDNYIELSFDAQAQAIEKYAQFDFNYRHFFPADKSRSVLDVGIGRGEMLSCMRDWGYDAYLGVDISPSAVRHCSELGLHCVFAPQLEEWLTQRQRKFAVITLLDVLEHVEKSKIHSFLSALESALAIDGVLIIQVPNLQAPDSNLHRYNDFTHNVGFVEHSLSQVLRAAGLTNIEYRGFETIIGRSPKKLAKRVGRSLVWMCTRLTRRLTDNLNPRVLNPVLVAVARKQSSP